MEFKAKDSPEDNNIRKNEIGFIG